jgi:1,4-dihydroxy-2-naphthoate octaprenyltransferase
MNSFEQWGQKRCYNFGGGWHIDFFRVQKYNRIVKHFFNMIILSIITFLNQSFILLCSNWRKIYQSDQHHSGSTLHVRLSRTDSPTSYSHKLVNIITYSSSYTSRMFYSPFYLLFLLILPTPPHISCLRMQKPTLSEFSAFFSFIHSSLSLLIWLSITSLGW